MTDHDRDPSTETWREALAEPERASLAALRGQHVADVSFFTARLERVESERDAARADLARAQQALAASQADLSNALTCFDDLQTAAGRKYELYEGELSRLRAELERERQESGRLRRELEELRNGAPQRPTPHLDAVKRQRSTAILLVEYALHLRQHGERAPGGNETWAQFDRDAEAFLRTQDSPAQPAPGPQEGDTQQ